MNKKIGFTIGKFAPLHKGHQYLIETAIKEMDEVIVVVYDTNLLDISSEVRAKWIKELYPMVKVIIAHNPPTKFGLDKESVEIQMKYLLEILGDNHPTHFYSSEEYGHYVAEYMNIVDRRVDNKREIIPISASKIRKDIESNKKFLEDNIYQDIKKYEL